MNPRPAGTIDNSLNNSKRTGVNRDCESLASSGGVEGSRDRGDEGDVGDGPDIKSKST